MTDDGVLASTCHATDTMIPIKRFAPVLLLSAAVACASPGRQAPAGVSADGEPAVHTLVVMLDGVPHAVMDSLWSAGHYRWLPRPSRVVSPFPSLTGVSFPSMWGAPPPPGYEDRYFDPEANRIRGGLLEHMGAAGEHAGFRRYVDIETGGARATLGYIFPALLAADELDRLDGAIQAQALHDSTVVAYLVSTDALAHREGREAVVAALLELESVLNAVRAHYGAALRILLFSDHGNNFTPSRRVAMEDALEAAGFRMVRTLRGENDVVVPDFGLVGSSFLYSWPRTESRLADALVAVDGVDLVMFEDESQCIHVRSRNGHATVEVRRDGWYRYTPLTGDPLQLADVAARFRSVGIADSAGFAPDSAWLAATLDGPYVDALRRIVRGMRSVVRHPASVVVSYKPGYYYGNLAADVLVDVAGTHGSLRTTASVAFFAGTGVDAPPVLRSDELDHYLPDAQPSGRVIH